MHIVSIHNRMHIGSIILLRVVFPSNTGSKDEYPANFPVSYHLLKAEQQNDPEVISLLCLSPDDYKTVTQKHGNHEYQLVVDKERCIYIPNQLQK